MKFNIKQETLKDSLAIIHRSKALSKVDGEDTSLLKIYIDKEQKTISFLSTNNGVWCSAIINNEDSFNIKENGCVYVDGNDFISMMNSYPKGEIVYFETEKNNDDTSSQLIAKCVNNGDSWDKISSFLISQPSYFEDEPPKEERNSVVVSSKELYDAVMSVEFATGGKDTEQEYWGVQIQIFDENDVASFATDITRICWYDKKGFNRDKNGTPILKINPYKNTIISSLSCLDLSENVEILFGQRFTILKQKNQWHGIPNAVTTGDGRMPDCRDLAEGFDNDCVATIHVNRQKLSDFIKSSLNTSSGKYGIRFDINTDKKRIQYSIDTVETGAVLKTNHKETEKLKQEQIEGEPFNDSILMAIDNIKDIVSKYKSEVISMKIIDSHSAIQIIDKDTHFRFITSVL